MWYVHFPPPCHYHKLIPSPSKHRPALPFLLHAKIQQRPNRLLLQLLRPRLNILAPPRPPPPPPPAAPYTNEIPLTDTAGKSVGTTAAVVVKTYSAAGTYASVFPPAQDTSDTDAPPTTTGGSNLTARVIYIVLGVLGLFGLALLLSLRVVAHLARRTRSNSDAFASLPSPHPKSTSSRSGP